MGIESLLSALASSGRPVDNGTTGGVQGVALPGADADPGAVARFSQHMKEGSVEPVTGAGNVPERPVEMIRQDAPATLGQRISADRINGTPEAEHSDVHNWLDSVTDIFAREEISPSELFRVQVLAGMAQIEASRNASVNQSLDSALKTLIKNS